MDLRSYCEDGYFDSDARINYGPFDNLACRSLPGYEDILVTYCNKGTNMFTDNNCKIWLTQNVDKNVNAKKLIDKRCGVSNLMVEPCKTIIQNVAINSSEFDKKILDYCKYNPNDKNCDCLNRPPNSGPMCMDARCSTSINPQLYKTFAQNNEKITCCAQSIDSKGGINVDANARVTINQVCGADTISQSTTNQQTTNPILQSTINQTSMTDQTFNKKYIIILLIMVVIIGAIIGIYLLFKPKKNKNMMFNNMRFNVPPNNIPNNMMNVNKY